MAERIEINGVTLRVARAVGSGPTVILLHEMGGALESWDAVAPLLAEHYTVRRYDQRGAGGSENPRQPFALDDLAEDVEALIAGLGIARPVHLAGVAVGAAVALLAAVRHPESVRSLVLASPAMGVDPSRRQYLLQRAAVVERDGMAVVADAALANSYPAEIRHDRDAYQRYRARFLAQDPTGYALWNRALAAVDEAHFPTAVRCPVLAVAGRHDRMRPPEKVAAFAARLPGAATAILDGGHLLSVQAPEALASAMRRFYDGLRP